MTGSGAADSPPMLRGGVGVGTAALAAAIRHAGRHAALLGWLALGAGFAVPISFALVVVRAYALLYRLLGEGSTLLLMLLMLVALFTPVWLTLAIRGRYLVASRRRFTACLRSLPDADRRALLANLAGAGNLAVRMLAGGLADDLRLRFERLPEADGRSPTGRGAPGPQYRVIDAPPPDPRMTALLRQVQGGVWDSTVPWLGLAGLGSGFGMLQSRVLADRWWCAALFYGLVAVGFAGCFCRCYRIRRRVRAGVASLPEALRKEALLALSAEWDSDVRQEARALLRRSRRENELAPAASGARGSEAASARPTS